MCHNDASCLNQFNLPNPYCLGMSELPNAATERARVSRTLRLGDDEDASPLFKHLACGLAYTTGSALGTSPPPVEDCLAAYQVPNKAGLTAGARAWSKHCHRSRPPQDGSDDEGTSERRKTKSEGWWGTASGPIPLINEKSLALFWKIMDGATWRNLHWLPHQVLVYEVRVAEGYGMRWARDMSQMDERPWIFRGFLEPQMENGHELGWRHSA
jgi:hypothetical protein